MPSSTRRLSSTPWPRIWTSHRSRCASRISFKIPWLSTRNSLCLSFLIHWHQHQRTRAPSKPTRPTISTPSLVRATETRWLVIRRCLPSSVCCSRTACRAQTQPTISSRPRLRDVGVCSRRCPATCLRLATSPTRCIRWASTRSCPWFHSPSTYRTTRSSRGRRSMRMRSRTRSPVHSVLMRRLCLSIK